MSTNDPVPLRGPDTGGTNAVNPTDTHQPGPVFVGTVAAVAAARRGEPVAVREAVLADGTPALYVQLLDTGAAPARRAPADPFGGATFYPDGRAPTGTGSRRRPPVVLTEYRPHPTSTHYRQAARTDGRRVLLVVGIAAAVLLAVVGMCAWLASTAVGAALLLLAGSALLLVAAKAGHSTGGGRVVKTVNFVGNQINKVTVK